MSAPDRLPWEPHPEGGFIAFPEGRAAPQRFARLTPNGSVAGSYTWRVKYDAAHIASVSGSKQMAADEATAAWPMAIKAAADLVDRARWEARTNDLIDQVLVGTLEPEAFEPQRASYADLMWIMDRVRHYRRTERVAQLQAVLSGEFFARRTRS